MNNKAGIVTIIDNNNYGNRLQNYAVQSILNQFEIVNDTMNNSIIFNNKNKYFLRKIKYMKNE